MDGRYLIRWIQSQNSTMPPFFYSSAESRLNVYYDPRRVYLYFWIFLFLSMSMCLVIVKTSYPKCEESLKKLVRAFTNETDAEILHR